METKSVVIELFSHLYCDGSKEFFLSTISSDGEIKREWFNNETKAVKKMRRYLACSSRFRDDWHNLIRIEIEKQFLD